MQTRVIRVRMLRQAVFTAAMAGLLTGQLLTAQNASSPQLVASAEAPPDSTTAAPAPTAGSVQQPGPTVLDELNSMKRRIEQLEQELKAVKGDGTVSPAESSAPLTPSGRLTGGHGSVLAPGTTDASRAVASTADADAGVGALADQSSSQPEAQPASA